MAEAFETIDVIGRYLWHRAIAFYLFDQICFSVSVTKCFYFLTDCCCCKQYQKIGKVLRRSPVYICRPKMELDRDPGGIGIVGRSSARWAPFNGGYDFVFLDKLSPVKFVPPVFFARGILSRPRVRTLLTSSIPWLSMT